MRCDDLAISVRNLTKTYRLFGHPGERIKQFFSLGLKRYHREFTALKDVSFDVKKGETVGVIGRNGSGKSTLLQLICGILKPTSGTVRVNGRVSALLELGAGFNPEFTGRENVYFQGALMGFTKAQMDEKFDEIAAFADIGEFIDQPVRTYSSGMFVRLAFAVAIHVEPDILVVDEALAVGDATFQHKCFGRIHDIRCGGGTVLLVTHVLEQVAHFCDRALWLDAGCLQAIGDSASVLSCYLESVGRSSSAAPAATPGCDDAVCHHPAYRPREIRWGDRVATIEAVQLFQEGRRDPATYFAGVPIELRFLCRFHADVARPVYGLTVKAPSGAQWLTTNSLQLGGPAAVPPQRSGEAVWAAFRFHPFFPPGEYLISLGVAGETPAGLVPHDRRYDVLGLRVVPPAPGAGSATQPSFQILSAPT